MPDQADVPAYADRTRSQSTSRGALGWLAPVALVLALVAGGLAIWALLRSSEESSSTDTSAASSDEAKEKVCGAFAMVQRAVSIQTNINLGPDPVAVEAVAANARLATTAGGNYLLSQLDPATPPELADAVRTFANNLLDVGIGQLAGIPNTNPTQTERMNEVEELSPRITEMCE